jgi:hypothetical protein
MHGAGHIYWWIGSWQSKPCMSFAVLPDTCTGIRLHALGAGKGAKRKIRMGEKGAKGHFE